MTDKVLCPYCGAEMMLDFQDDGYEFGAAYYVCQECGSTSPTANTDAAALSAAQARYLPPTHAEMDAAGWGDAYEPATND